MVGNRVVCIARELLGSDHAAAGALAAAARARLVSGELIESLVCLSLSGDATWLEAEGAAAARARVELLLWEAGATATTVPELGVWLWSDAVAQRELLHRPARGTLRERSIAAGLLAVASDGMPIGGTATSLAVDVTALASELAAHPEPSVWVPAVRALGRLAARIPSVRFQLLRWLASARASRRRRATTALASVPAARGEWVGEHLERILASKDPWQLAALGPAVPFLVRERASLWSEIAPGLVARPGAEVVWSITAGLVALGRGQELDPFNVGLLRQARSRALAARPRSFAEAQLWQVIRRDSDFLDGIDPDPSFPDHLLDRAVRDAVRLGADAVQQRVAAIASSIGGTFDAMLRSVSLAPPSPGLEPPSQPPSSSSSEGRGRRGHALAALESCARAVALALWQPIIVASAGDPAGVDAEVGQTRAHMGAVLADYLELDELDFALRRAALRAFGNLIDATASDHSPGRVAAIAAKAVARSKWARDSSREAKKRFRKPVADLLWRINDALRGDAGGRDREPGQLAAWWVLGVSGIELLELARYDSPEVAARVALSVTAIRNAGNAAIAGASVASWSGDVLRALDDLGVGETRLGQACGLLFAALESAETAIGMGLERELAEVIEFVATPTAMVGELCHEPALALAPRSRELLPPRGASELIAAAAQAIATGEPAAAAVAEQWASKLGPLLRPIVARSVRRLVELARASVVEVERKVRIGPYRKLRKLGGGGQGEVWLVRGEGTRRFVVKVPHLPRSLADDERAALGRVLAQEAALLESLHEAKVATYCDHGFDGSTPYLVLQYLIGTNLRRYAEVAALTIGELKPIVRDICLGLRALHERGIVHRDLKPSNVFLRLQLPRAANEQFAAEHRALAVAPLAEAVLIDFGIAKLVGAAGRVAEDRAEGTLGYLAPEQTGAGHDIAASADVYGLAATIFTAATGRRFFSDRVNKTAYVLAHAFEPPFADAAVVAASAGLPAALRRLLEAATALDPGARPSVDEFADHFAAL